MTPPVPPPPLPPDPASFSAPLPPSPPLPCSAPLVPSEKTIPGVATAPVLVDSQPSSGDKGFQSSSQATPTKVEFNWAKNLDSASRFPESTAPVTTSAEGRPRVRISNGVFERGAKIHNDYIVGIFYGKAPSYGKIWGVLNYLWGKDRRKSKGSAPSQEWRQVPLASMKDNRPQAPGSSVTPQGEPSATFTGVSPVSKAKCKDKQIMDSEPSSSVSGSIVLASTSVPAPTEAGKPTICLTSDPVPPVTTESMELCSADSGFIMVSSRASQCAMVEVKKALVVTSNSFELLQNEQKDQGSDEGNQVSFPTEFSPSSSASVNRKQKKRKLRSSP
ncbi:hypothetical protein IGI04_021764, partial [Brassica rapa subsp. trilocularis]